MDLTTQAYLAAGLGSLALGVAALLRAPGRARARLFGALALTLATWTLASAARHADVPGREAWRALSYAGACAAAPVTLHLALVLARRARDARRLLTGAYVTAAAATVLAFLLRDAGAAVRMVAMGVPMLVILGLAVQQLHRDGLLGEGGADRGSLRILMGLGVVAALVGLTDLIPRGASGIPPLGPLAVLPVLFALATIGLQRRYLDLDRTVARIVAVGLSAVAASAFLQAVTALAGPSALTFFLAGLVIVASAGPLVGAILSGTRALLDPGSGEAARALADASAELARAEDATAAWDVFQRLAPRLPGGARIEMKLGADAPGAGTPLARLLMIDRAPVTRRLLELDAREASDRERRDLASAALAQARELGFEIVAPLIQDEKLGGIVALGGGDPSRYVGGEAGVALVALGHQALATLQRIDAVERARRKEALAVVGEMAASLAHDVRNPLAAIRGAAQVLAEARDAAQEKEMIEVIDSESERLGRVLGEFLEWARPRPSARVPVDLAALAHRAALGARLGLGGPPVDVVADPAAPRALGDEDLLARAVSNLVRNACEAAGAGGRVRIAVEPAAGGRVSLRVQDDGPGLPQRVKDRLFEPFVTTKPGGTGLGLALVLRAAEACGGEARAEDVAPHGTAFTLVLPASAAGHDAHGSAS